ncbi:MAG: SLBB domain-containing protein [Candidatus Izemoplasmatales bacterium]
MKSWIQRYGGFLFLGIGIMGMVYFLTMTSTSSVSVLAQTTTEVVQYVQTSTVDTEGIAYVDVKGAVRYPGVYVAGVGMRIADVVEMAGGFLEEADSLNINLAKTVYDQMVIYIPFQSSAEDESKAMVCVEIKGEILLPGVYELEVGSRLFELLALAGGLTTNADASSLNLSQILVDEMVIEVPLKPQTEETATFKVYLGGAVEKPGEYYVLSTDTLLDLISYAGGLTTDADTTNLIYQMTLFEHFSMTIPSRSSSETTTDSMSEESGLVNLNTATLDELMTLQGIGIILGQRIIDYRAANGLFETIEDVMKVSGIKDSIFEDIRYDITV